MALVFHQQLICNAYAGDEHAARELLDSGKIYDIDWRDSSGYTALMYAAANGHVAVVDLLPGRGAQVDAATHNGTDAMMLAAERDQAHVIPLLIQGGADVLRQDINGINAFGKACVLGHIASAYATIEELSREGDVAVISALVGSHGPGGVTPLIAAAMEGHLEVVMHLIELGADVNLKADAGFDALLAAAQRGHCHVVQYLLAFGADVETTDLTGDTALIRATASGHLDVIEVLLDAGACVNYSTRSGKSALHYCIGEGHTEVASRLVRAGGDVLLRCGDGSTPFFLACLDEDTETVEELINVVADVAQPSILASMVAVPRFDGMTPLMAASCGGCEDIVSLLVAAGVDVNTKHEDGNDALLVAAQNDEFAVAQCLLANGANVDTSDGEGVTPLMHAANGGLLDLMHLFVQAHANIDHQDSRGRRALWYAAQQGQCEAIAYLLDLNTGIDFQDALGSTALMVASMRNHESAVALLIQRHANVNITDLDGNTALIAAATYGHASIARMLLEAGSDHSHELHLPIRGNALFHAAIYGHEDTVRVLVDHGADVNAQGSDGSTALMAAVGKGHIDVCRFLLEHNANTDIQTGDARTALHIAVASRKTDGVRLLIKAGADTTVKETSGFTASLLAAFLGEFDMVALLEQAPGSDRLEPSDVCGVWPVSSLLEFYDQMETDAMRVDPPWYIDPALVIESPLPCGEVHPTAVITNGTWLGSRVKLIKPSLRVADATEQLIGGELVSKEAFVFAIHQWIPLSHPHVLKLFGACHRRQPFLVVEYTQGTLRSFLKDHPGRTWRTLHQVALGLQYLHERGMMHGNLHGDIITFSEDGIPKLGGLSVFEATNVRATSEPHWSPPELLIEKERTPQSDMYSFGMCIIEAVSGDLPFAAEVAAGANIEEDFVKKRKIPTKHKDFTDRGWELVQSLTATFAAKRLSIDALLQELEALAVEEEQQSFASMPCSTRQLTDRVESARLLDEVSTDPLQTNLLSELTDIVTDLASLDDSEHGRTLTNRCFIIVDRFALHLEERKTLSRAQLHAARRQHVATIKSLHIDVERLVEDLGAGRAMGNPSWRDLWNSYWLEQQREFEHELEAVSTLEPPSGDIESHTEQLSCMLFEITTHRRRYGVVRPAIATSATDKIIEQLGSPLPKWFFPWYEVSLATTTPFCKGGFGEVYRGKWMGSHVVGGEKYLYLTEVRTFL